MKSSLIELAKCLGIDPGPLNQADLQEQTCAAALEHIKWMAVKMEENHGLQFEPSVQQPAATFDDFGHKAKELKR